MMQSGGQTDMVRVLIRLLGIACLALVFAGLPSAGPITTATPVFAQQAAMILPDDPAPLVIHTALGNYNFSVEVADEPNERARGLMFREEMASDHGMLFDFGGARDIMMWMKNTPMPLDMVFIRADGTVARVAERTVPFSEDVIPSGEPVSHVLELRAGVARLIGLKPGDRLEHPALSR